MQVKLDIAGYPVLISDTAGIRDTDNSIEAEGIRRARLSADEADLVLWLSESETVPKNSMPENAVIVRSKADNTSVQSKHILCSTKSSDGLAALLSFIENRLHKGLSNTNSLVGRERHKIELEQAANHLSDCLSDAEKDITLRSEDLRLAGEAIGRITGHIDVEDLLDLIFSEFCIGK